MSISFDVTITGSELGRQLVRDPEELGYAFLAMIEEAPDNLAAQIAECLSDHDVDAVAEFLGLLADQLNAAT